MNVPWRCATFLSRRSSVSDFGTQSAGVPAIRGTATSRRGSRLAQGRWRIEPILTHSSDQLALGGDGNHDQIFRDPASPVFRGAESPEELIAGRSLPGQFAETGPLRFVED